MGVNGIYGLSGSGLDIESLVKVGMMSKQNEYDKMYKNETKLNWKKEAYSTLYTDMTAFNLTKLSDYKMSSKMNAMTASSSNESAVTATANGNAASMSHSVQVTSLSTNAYLQTEAGAGITRHVDLGDSEAKSTSIYLKDNVFKDIKAVGDDATYTYKGVTYTGRTASEPDKNGDITYTLTGATDGSADVSGISTLSITTNAKKYEITDKDGKTHTVDGDAAAISFTVRTSDKELSDEELSAQTITYTYEDLMNGKSYNNLASDIKGMNIGIQASYDSVNDSFSIYNRTGGADNKIYFDIQAADDFADGEGVDQATATPQYNGGTFAAELLNNLNLGKIEGDEYTKLSDDFFAEGTSKEAAAGTNGAIKIDGQTYTNITDNKVTVGGVTYSLLGTTPEGSSARVTVSQDTSSIIDSVKSFVEDYNKMLDELNDKYNEAVYSDYGVLTKSQEDSMTKEQIEKWNEKAKSGILYHDKILGGIISDMRTALATPVEGVDGKYNSAFSLGITTSTDRGHIKLDEDKLKKALEAEPNSVYQIFGKLDSNDDYDKNGVAQRLSDAMYAGLKKIKAEAGSSTEAADGSTIGNKILEWRTKMSDFKKMMSSYENLLFKKYDNMETAIQKLSMTLSYVTYNNG